MASEKAPQAVIDWINTGRAVVGLPPLNDLYKGVRGSAHACPIAHSLKGIQREIDPSLRISVSGESVQFYDSKKIRTPGARGICWVDMPRSVQKWIRQFDAGKWPDYEL
jgi:hypothetical protein